ncbi:MAG: branched-chain amino acid ABC transporter permease [Clostridia bacterium]|nr:branched-chain amino acid ABC transporter permease [Clostridia bacterium]
MNTKEKTSYFKDIQKSFKFKHYVNYIVVGAALILFAVLYFTGSLNRSTPNLLLQIGYSIILAVSLNLVVGLLGELSLGHAGFMCVGAYLGTFASNYLLQFIPSLPLCLVISMLIGGAVAGLFGFIVGLPALRLKGDYLAIVTLAFGEIVRNICRNLPFFGGAMGLESEYYSAMLMQGKKAMPLFIPAFVVVLIMLFVIQNLIRSKHGRAITAIRDNEIAAKAMGINVTYYKLFAFVVSAVFAGIAGVLYGASLSPVSYSAFSYNYSIEILVMVVLGGMGSINGSIIAATLITYINFALKSEFSGDMSAVKNLIYALILIVMVIYKNAPALKGFREKYTLKNILEKILPKKDASYIHDDTADWDVITTKIPMDEVLSVDVKVVESVVEPDKTDLTQKGDNE